jgi:hypothetical protein
MVCLAFQVIDFSDVVLERQALGGDWAPVQLTLLALYAIAFLVGFRTSNRSYHGVLAVAWLLTCISWGIGALDDPILAL